MTYPAPDKMPKDDWFDNPLDNMPIAKDFTNPRPEEEIADNYASRHKSTPDHEKGAEEVVTMHEKMYRMATARYNPFSIGGSENCHSDIDCPTGIGGSENAFKFQGGSEQPQKKTFDWEETAPSEYEPPDDRPLLDPHDDPFGGY